MSEASGGCGRNFAVVFGCDRLTCLKPARGPLHFRVRTAVGGREHERRVLVRRGVPVGTVPGVLVSVAVVLGSAGIRDPTSAAAVLARPPAHPLLRVSLRRLTPPGAASRRTALS